MSELETLECEDCYHKGLQKGLKSAREQLEAIKLAQVQAFKENGYSESYKMLGRIIDKWDFNQL